MASIDTQCQLSLGKIDPEVKKFLVDHPTPLARFDNLAMATKLFRQRNEAVIASVNAEEPGIRRDELNYPGKNGRKVRAKLYRPQAPAGFGSPLIVMFHGGGFCFGAPENEEVTCCNLVRAFGAVCISAAYGLAPEFPFPFAIQDAWNALQWAAENATSWGADPAVGFIVGGTSAGGNISAVLTHMSRDKRLSPPLTGQYVAVPILVAPSQVPEKFRPYYLSHDQNKNAPLFSKNIVDILNQGYNADEKDALQYSVLNHPEGHAGLPPTFIQACGMDPLRDDAIIYEQVLREEAGVKTKMYLYPGAPHAHWAFMPQLASSDKFRKDQLDGIGWMLGMTPDLSKFP